MFLPLHLITTTLLGLLSVAVLAAGMYLLYRAWRTVRPRRYYLPRESKVRTPDVGIRRSPTPQVQHVRWSHPAVTTPIAAGVLLLLMSFGGRHVIQYAFPVGQDEPNPMRSGTVQSIAGAAGSKLHVEFYGPVDAPTLVLTHGWGMNSTEWYYAKRDFGPNFRIIVWDLPGLGESSRPDDGDFALETLARDLRSVVNLAKGKPVILVGHSIGGMINLTFCRLFPELLGHEIAGIVQVDTTLY